jgi:hypothetical protein
MVDFSEHRWWEEKPAAAASVPDPGCAAFKVV